MLVYIDPRRPTGIGESLSGAPAFYIHVTTLNRWAEIEQHPAFLALPPAEQQIIRDKFPICLERYRFLQAAHSS